MTEIPDLGAFFRGVPPPHEPSEAEKKAAEHAHAQQHAEQERMVTLMAFWAPVLCSCRVWPEKGNTRPPQEDCMIHGTVMMNACTGFVYLPGQFPPKGEGHEHG